ncbi:hypothetical protein K040078D81_43580 [Blautia hominis]|uniref:Uncharacterized protein n=1 Tax=Blautia hominis TaxID=2025493 RepID=A0ABQ0BFP5_9FIRM
MVNKRKLAVPVTTAFICTLPKGTQEIIRDDLEAYAREHKITLDWDNEARDYIAMTRRFCDIDEIYDSTDLEFCDEGEDIEAYEKSQQRGIVLHLKDIDVEKLCKTAGMVGLSVSELLENFVEDLIDGERMNGSYERMLANQWFENCWFSRDTNYSFLSYLLERNYVDRMLDIWEWLEDYKLLDELNKCQLETQTWMQEEVDIAFETYMEFHGKGSETIEEEMKKVLEWKEEYEKIMGISENCPVQER